jgi:hypothetical protein
VKLARFRKFFNVVSNLVKFDVSSCVANRSGGQKQKTDPMDEVAVLLDVILQMNILQKMSKFASFQYK